MKDINPIISVVEGKLCINGIIFEHNELRESKEYLQSIGAEEALFYPEDEDETDELHKVIMEMADASPEASDDDITSYYLN
tara:strand:+ start:287 stop:529 length:243 start_codon:yes stop_codon:yes gene_type:complete